MLRSTISLVFLYTVFVISKGVYSFNPHSRYPVTATATNGSKGQINVKFTVKVPENLTISDFTSKPGSKFQLFVQPPSYLKFEKVKSKFALVSGSQKLDKTHQLKHGAGFFTRTNTDPKTELCTEDLLYKAVVSAMDEAAQFATGIFVNDTESMKKLADVSKAKDVGLQNVLETTEERIIKAGEYTWEATYKRRTSPKAETGVSKLYNDWVVAFVVDGDDKLVDQESSFCSGYDGLSAKVFLNESKTKKYYIISCNGYPDHFLLKDSMNVAHKELDATIALGSDSNGHKTLDLKFKVEEEHKTNEMDGNYYELRLKLPQKSTNNDNLLNLYKESELCKANKDVEVESCKLDKEDGKLVFTIKKTSVAVGTYHTINIDVDKYINAIPAVYNWAAHLYIKADKTEKYNPFSQTIKLEASKLDKKIKNDDHTHKSCTLLVKDWCAQTHKNVVAGTGYTPVGMKAGPVNLLGNNMYILTTISKARDMYLAKIYIPKTNETEGKNVNITISGILPNMLISKPNAVADRFNSKLMQFLTVPKGHKYVYSRKDLEINVKFDKPKDVASDEKFYYEVPLAFKHDMHNIHDVVDYFVENVKFKLYNVTDGKHITVLKTGVFSGASKLENSVKKNSSFSGPYFYTKGNTTRLIFDLNVYLTHKNLYTLKIHPAAFSGNECPAGIYYKDAYKTAVRCNPAKGTVEFFMDTIVSKGTYGNVKIIFDFNTDAKKQVSTRNVVLTAHGTSKENKNLFNEILKERKDPSTIKNDLSDLSSYDLAILQENLSMSNTFNDFVNELTPCVGKHSRTVVVPYNKYENATYVMTRLQNCRYPWLPFLDDRIKQEFLTMELKDRQYKHANLKIHELLQLDEAYASVLMKERKFLEYTLFVFFDKNSAEVLRDQMIATNECTDRSNQCAKDQELKTVEAFVDGLVKYLPKDSTNVFDNVRIGYFDNTSKKLVIKNKKLIDDAPEGFVAEYERTVPSLNSSKDALEVLLNDAFAHVEPNEVSSSFSVVAFMDDKDATKLKGGMNKYSVQGNLQENNELLHPVFVNVIPVDKTSTFESKNSCPDAYSTPKLIAESKLTVTTNHNGEIDSLFDADGFYNNVYVGFKFNNKDTEGTDFLTPSEPKKVLKGAEPTAKTLKRDLNHSEYTIYFGFNGKLAPVCVNTTDDKVTPMKVKAAEAVYFIAKALAKNYVISASCAKYNSLEDSQKGKKFTLAFNGVGLNEFSLPKYSYEGDLTHPKQCNLMSLYQTVPKTLHGYKDASETQVKKESPQPLKNEEKKQALKESEEKKEEKVPKKSVEKKEKDQESEVLKKKKEQESEDQKKKKEEDRQEKGKVKGDALESSRVKPAALGRNGGGLIII